MSVEPLVGQSILVTGATGFLGAHLVRRLISAGARVACLVSGEASVQRLPAGAVGRAADLRDAEAVREGVRWARPTLAFHLAAVGVTQFDVDPLTAVGVNVAGTVALLTALEDTACRRFLYVGTGHEYGDAAPPLREDRPPAPTNVYAASKSAGWLFCQMIHRARGWPVVAVRPFGVYGPGQQPPAFLPSLVQSALRGQDFAMTGGEQVRDLIYVDDLIGGMIRAATAPGVKGRLFNLCSGQGVSLVALARRVVAAMGHPIRLDVGALPYRPGTLWSMVGDNSRARRALDWRPAIGLDEGLRRTIEWWRQRWEREKTAA
jgi:nucleoside-diphosphate-sugar epimerase